MPCFLNGYDTILSKEFGGVDLSGGEWQKVALARSCYRDCDVIVLDEPTSMIDPEHEEFLYKSFDRIGTGKVEIIVTHRMSALKNCNKIIVMNHGVISDIGTHNELFLRCEEYKRLYNTQSIWYVD